MTNGIGEALIVESKRQLVDESLPRIIKCLSILSDEEIWLRPNENTVSVGNLVIHLCGNVRQWIISGLGGAEDHRDRDSEFSERGVIPKADLVERLENTLSEACDTMDGLDTTSMLKTYNIQGNVETGVGVLVHVVEHFSYHTGQITLAVKTRKNVDLSYFADQDLNATN